MDEFQKKIDLEHVDLYVLQTTEIKNSASRYHHESNRQNAWNPRHYTCATSSMLRLLAYIDLVCVLS